MLWLALLGLFKNLSLKAGLFSSEGSIAPADINNYKKAAIFPMQLELLKKYKSNNSNNETIRLRFRKILNRNTYSPINVFPLVKESKKIFTIYLQKWMNCMYLPTI